MGRTRSGVVVGVLALAVLVAIRSNRTVGQDAPSPSAAPNAPPPDTRLAGDSLPTPPRQSSPWTPPPTKLPKAFVSATETLFKQGLADPRGCQYREIEVVVGDNWASSSNVKTHGWVVPSVGKETQHFGVCWNGLVYPLASIGKPADLRADALAASKVDPAWRFGEDVCLCYPSEERSVSNESPLPIKACLLLRLGETELAEKVWSRWSSRLRSRSADGVFLSIEESAEANRSVLKDPYLALANCWTLALFDRATAAHIRSDDHLALASVEELNALWPAVKAEAEKRGFREPSRKRDTSAPYFLIRPDRVNELLVDQRRRAEGRKNGTGPPILSSQYHVPETFFEAITGQVGQIPDKKSRAAFLLHELEEASRESCVDSPDDLFPLGAVNGTLVSLLVEQGEDAVEPLLTCLESDNRLSRFQPQEECYPIGVHRFAEQPLALILKMPFRDFDDVETSRDESKRRQAVAARIRAYWKRSKNLPPAERWYGVLADDHAKPYQWLAAARCIVQPNQIPVTLDSSTSGWGSGWFLPSPGWSRMHGDVLRERNKPSVAELMTKRLNAFNQPCRELLAKRRSLDERIKKLDERLGELQEILDTASPEQVEEYNKKQDEVDKLNAQRDELDSQEWTEWDSFCDGCDMAFCLAQWLNDSQAAKKTLREETDLCRRLAAVSDRFGTQLLSEEGSRTLRMCRLHLLLARTAVGESEASDELPDGWEKSPLVETPSVPWRKP